MKKALGASLALVGVLCVLFTCVSEVQSADNGVDTHSASAGDHVVGDSTHTGNDTGHEEDEVHRYTVAHVDFNRVMTPYVISAWIILASLAKIIFHLNNKLSAIFPESCLLIILGVILGVILFFTKVEGYEMDTSVFFFYLLPPIILEAGYFMPNRAFFDNLGTILLYAVLGTLLNCLWIGFSVWGLSKSTGVGWIPYELDMLQCLVFSALLSAVDPVAVLAVFEQIHVNEILHIVVFGESLLNDAVTVVLYHMFEAYSEIGQGNIIAVDIILGMVSFLLVVVISTLIGMTFGFLTAFITRFCGHVRVIEPLVVLVMGYLSYLTAEIFHLSGILACTMCGITMRKYVEKNISAKSHTTIKYFLKMLASTCETIIFMLLGASTVVDTHQWDTAFILLTLFFCLLYRTIAVIILTFFANRVRLNQLSKVDQFVMAYGGLRGAIAFSLVVLLDEHHFPQRRLFITATVVVVYFTVFIQGTTIKPLVNFLKVKKANKRKPTMNEQINNRLIDHFMAGIEDVAGHHGHHKFREKFEYIDNKYLKPIFIKQKGLQSRGQSIVSVFNKLNEKDASDYLRKRGSFSMPSNGSGSNLPSHGSFADLYHQYHIPRRGSEAELHDASSSATLDDSAGQKFASIPVSTDSSSTRLDMKVLEANTNNPSMRMRSDSFFHHIMDDALFKTRQRFKTNHRHMLHDTEPQDNYHHNARYKLRKLLSSFKHHSLNHHHHHHNDDDDHDEHKKKTDSNKNVSFGQLNGDSGVVAGIGEDRSSSGSDSGSDTGVVFTVSPEEEEEEVVHAEPTVAESSLPWKRNTGREPVSSTQSHSMPEDAGPRSTEPPAAWVEQADFLPVPPPAEPSPEHVSISIEDDHKLGGDHQQEDGADGSTEAKIPPPWRQQSGDNDEAPVPSPSLSINGNNNGGSGDKTLLPEPSSHSFRLSEAESRHSEHVHMTPMIDPEAEPRETPINGEIVLDEDDSVDNALRVQQWLNESDGTGQDPAELEDEYNKAMQAQKGEEVTSL